MNPWKENEPQTVSSWFDPEASLYLPWMKRRDIASAHSYQVQPSILSDDPHHKSAGRKHHLPVAHDAAASKKTLNPRGRDIIFCLTAFHSNLLLNAFEPNIALEVHQEADHKRQLRAFAIQNLGIHAAGFQSSLGQNKGSKIPKLWW